MYKGKAVYWQENNKLKESFLEFSEVEKDKALVEVKYCGICGTDTAIYKGLHPRATAPLVLGHEFSGIVKRIDSKEIKEGDRVVVNPLIYCGKCSHCKKGKPHKCRDLKLLGIDKNGAFSKYIVVDKDKLHKIPDDLDFKTACLVEVFATAAHAAREASPGKKDLVVVMGGGPIGIATGLFFKHSGIENIIISEISDFRLKVIKKLGFNAVDANNEDLLEIIKKASNGRLADIVVEATGTSESVFNMVSLARTDGLIILVGISHKHPVVNLRDVVFKHVTIKGIRVYSKEDFSRAASFVIKYKEILKDYVSKTFDLDDLDKALEYAGNPNISSKIVVRI